MERKPFLVVNPKSYLYGKESNDKNIEYVGWEKYGDIPSSFFNDFAY